MRKLLLIAAVSATLVFLGVGNASAGHRGGGCGGHGGHGGCGSGGCGSGGCGSGGCGYGGGYSSCGSGGCGYASTGCSTCGYAAPAAPATGKVAYGAPTCTGPNCTGVAALTGRQEATLVVNLPANATLLIDDYQTKSTSANRVFRTPALETGKDFHYTLTAQVPTADGKMETITKDVTVRAGESTSISIEAPSAAVAAK
jgi:uncharacterized protein (TIGR03000 family)